MSKNDYQVCTSLAQLRAFRAASEAAKAPINGFDYETTGLDPYKNRICGFSLSYRAHEAIYVPLYHSSGQCADEAEVVPFMKQWLQEADFVAHNASFEWQWIRAKWGIVGRFVVCSMILGYMDDPNRVGRFDKRSVALKKLAQELWNIDVINLTDLIDLKTQNFSYLPVKDAVDYACQDADLAFRLYQRWNAKLMQEQPIIYRLEMELIPVTSGMTLRGIKMNSQFLEEGSDAIDAVIAKLERDTFELMGFNVHEENWVKPFELGSSARVSEHLFDVMGLPAGRVGTSGRASTSKKELANLKDAYPVVAKLLAHREAVHMKSSFLDALPRYVNEVTGYIHGNFNQTGAPTGRFSHSRPNLANIPKKRD